MIADLAAQDHPDGPASSTAQAESVAGLLQPVVADLIVLVLYAKNAHWNVSGPGFRSAHLALDELVVITSSAADSVAERLRALGVGVDGTPQAVTTRMATVSPVAHPTGTTVPVMLSWVADLIGIVTTRLRAAAGRVGQTDAPTGDLLNAITLDLEKQKWLLSSES
ncbi:Dps family protein [Myceligenerans pegani]|uniref:DNA starvation/stationary phase protection protein n=1 Tax=Myceligenerans pegani TaxID=2776917 RepID=A0ABR9MYS7_9MICO|nr:DNA starvation/stationary phase protection protein [Myceligenerans sp. TRM 65318]MBE1876529.1 DNA starvation/stationary phase protection protein [Myceligenerans sp. TRM 65318]MBE3018800.1 DNA starvation/stationary phase protection protein [Myceligenerans sp. TRM 65318]